MRLAKIGVSEKKSRLLPLKALRTVLKFTIPTIVEDDEEFYDFYQDEGSGRIYPKFTVQGNLDGLTFYGEEVSIATSADVEGSYPECYTVEEAEKVATDAMKNGVLWLMVKRNAEGELVESIFVASPRQKTANKALKVSKKAAPEKEPETEIDE